MPPSWRPLLTRANDRTLGWRKSVVKRGKEEGVDRLMHLHYTNQIGCWSANMGAFASVLNSAADWRGEELARSDTWIRHLNDAEIGELDSALAHAKAKGLSGTQVTRADFPLKGLAETLDALGDELANGRGFFLLRGLPVERYSKQDASTIYWGWQRASHGESRQ